VAIDGDNVLIGAPADNTNGSFVGQVHLFDATTGALLQTFDDPTVTTFDTFGWSVAIDGNNVLIGAANDDTNGVNVGQVHLFDATTGALLQTFDDPTPTQGDGFGYSVALDGNKVLVGARTDDTTGVNVGQAHLFDATTGALLQTFDDPTVTGVDFFGVSVALDGNKVLIGASLDNTNGANVGQAHLYTADLPAVPLPAALPLFGTGLGILGFLGWRRRALSEENSKYSRWSWNPLSQSGKSREINGGEIRSQRAGKVFNFSLTMPGGGAVHSIISGHTAH
jgi:WD40 repeat protein